VQEGPQNFVQNTIRSLARICCFLHQIQLRTSPATHSGWAERRGHTGTALKQLGAAALQLYSPVRQRSLPSEGRRRRDPSRDAAASPSPAIYASTRTGRSSRLGEHRNDKKRAGPMKHRRGRRRGQPPLPPLPPSPPP
jgi:hypothetical protein